MANSQTNSTSQNINSYEIVNISRPFIIKLAALLLVVFVACFISLVVIQHQTKNALVRNFSRNYAQFISIKVTNWIYDLDPSAKWEEQTSEIARVLTKKVPISELSGILILNKSGEILSSVPSGTQCQPSSQDGAAPIVVNNVIVGQIVVCAELTSKSRSWTLVNILKVNALTSQIAIDYGQLVASQFAEMIGKLKEPMYWDIHSNEMEQILSELLTLNGIYSIGVFAKNGDMAALVQTSNPNSKRLISTQASIIYDQENYGRVAIELDLPEIRIIEKQFEYFIEIGAILAIFALFAFPTFIVLRLEKKAQAAFISLHESNMELQATQLQLVNSAKMAAIGIMAAGIGHEINNPLMVITGNSDLLLSNLKKGQFDTKYILDKVTLIHNTSFKISKIINSLRLLSRDGRKDPYTLSALSTIVDDALEICSARCQNKGVQLKIQRPEKGLSIECRPSQVGQVLLNLINNSTDAIEGLDEKWIEVSFKDLGEVVEISVTDSGTGVPPEARENMFVPFATTKAPGKGTGLGLNISKRIVEDHGGTLTLDVDAPHTRFVVRFPKRQKETTASGVA